MVFFQKDAWYWLEHEKEAWIPVRLIKQNGDKIIAKSTSGEQFEIPTTLDMPGVNPSSLSHCENMVTMEELSEAAILHNLRLRYDENLIYTYISSILVSVNPFKMLPIYSPAIMKEYRAKMANHEKTSPHVYALSDNAFKALTRDGQNQSVIISGESGAGKTEATKLVLQYMAEMSGQGNDIEQQLLEANPIIEAFGNSKTVRNNNSSRFGKWVEILFDEKFHIVGAKIYNYLLEKSRVISPAPGERNYHLFYQLCAGSSKAEKKKWALDHPGQFRYLATGNTLEIEGVDDHEEFKEMRSALNVLHFSQDEMDMMFQCVSAVLNVGNIEFGQTGEAANIVNPKAVDTAAELLGIPSKELSGCLISQRKQMGRENVLTVRNQLQAENSRDALAKSLYGNLFNWLIARINVTLASNIKNYKVVGVLDIFGFEIFEVNRFEQFCINFANEKMQQHFNEHIFTMEQAEYKAEKVDVAHVSFVDNQPCLDMIETGKTSLLGMVDEEIRLPKGSDENLLQRMHTTYNNNKYYTKPKTNALQFSVSHYAGAVTYQINGFMEKNKDTLEVNIAEAITKSKVPLIASLLQNEQTKQTLGSQFKQQLGALMDTLKRTAPHFIRCIKPNSLKVADTFDAPMVLRQLRYLGLKEVVNIRQLGYPVRRTHKDFFDRYALLSKEKPKGVKDYKKAATQLIQMLGVNDRDWRIGSTKVFTRQHVQTALETAREKKLTKLVIRLQALARGKIWRARFKRVKACSDRLRKAMKGTSHEEIDAAIQAYEALKIRVDQKLVQEAMKIRNTLYEQQQAKRALDAALKSRDLELITAAANAAEKAKLDSKYPPLVEAKQLINILTTYNKEVKEALSKRDKALCQKCVATAQKLGLDGPLEKQCAAVLASLEEETQLKSRLEDAMKNRDLEAIRHALKVAMSAKSGNMVNNALQQAMEAGLANDPVVKAAMAMEATLDKEVSVYKMAAELQAAITSGDPKILESTINLAKEKGLGNHNLTKQAEELLVSIKKGKKTLAALAEAIKRKDEAELSSLIDQANKENLQSTAEYQEAVRVRDTLRGVKEGLKNAKNNKDGKALDDVVAAAIAMGVEDQDIRAARDMRDSLAANDAIQKALKTAISARDVTLLHSAIARAKKHGMPTSHASVVEAQQLLDDLVQESDAMRLELQQAEAASDGSGATNKSTFQVGDVEVKWDRSKYMTDHFTLGRYGDLRTPNAFAEGSLFKKKTVKTSMLRFTKDVIPRSLTRLNDDHRLSQVAVNLFKSVQGFMLDRHYSFPDSLVSELVEELLVEPDLRNEVYLQVMKQISYNPKDESDLRGWMLLSLLCESIAPSKSFIYFVLHFLDEHLEKDDTYKHVPLYAAYAMHSLKKTVRKFQTNPPQPAPAPPPSNNPDDPPPTRKHYMSVEHVTTFRERTMQPADVRVTFPDGTQHKIFVQPWITNDELLPMISQQVGLQDTEGIAIFEMRGTEAQYLYGNECLLDFQNQWNKQQVKEEIKKEKKGFFAAFRRKAEEKEVDIFADAESEYNTGVRRFVIKRRVYGKPIGESRDRKMINLMASQFARDFATGCFAVEENAAIMFAAQHKALFETKQIGALGNIPPPAPESMTDQFAHVQYWELPQNMTHGKGKLDPKKFIKNVEKTRTEVGNISIDQYLAECKKLSTFGAGFFKVTQSYDTNYPADLVIGVNFFGVFLLDSKTRIELEHFPLMSVLGWSSTPVRVLIKVKLGTQTASGVSTATIRFNTSNPRMGKEICDLLLAYANEMMKAIGLASQMKQR